VGKKSSKSTKLSFKPKIEVSLLFGKYDVRQVVINDPGLAKYINLDPVYVAHVGAKYANRHFGKSRVNIVERLINEMMRTEHYTGKKASAYKAVCEAFEIIESRLKMNPIQILINAIQNAGPREEVTRLRYGGISVPKAVDTSPARRLDLALRHLTMGAVSSSHKNKKSIAECLATELINASKGDMNSFAIARKEEKERVAISAR
jgi:small subunit ribosomal protein S7